MIDRPGCLVLGRCRATNKPCCYPISPSNQTISSSTPFIPPALHHDAPCSRYVTQFSVGTSTFDRVINETAIRICCPFYETQHKSRVKLVWHIVRSEAFLFTFQFITLVLGVVKQMGENENVYPRMHLAYCIVEILITSMLIALRTISLRMKLKKFDVHFDLLVKGPDFWSSPKYLSLLIWVNIYTVLAVFLFVVNTSVFALFYYLCFTDWTVLTNNLVLAVITIGSGIFSSRLNASVARFREDEHKVVTLS